jgi:hypothetical protein
MQGGVQDVDARHKGEHDELEQRRVHGFRAQACGLPRNDGSASKQNSATAAVAK